MGSQKKWPVRLTVQDREELVRVTTTGVRGASMIMRARVLLALDTSVGEVDSKEVIAARLGVSGETLRLVAKRFAETGGDVHATIARKKRDLPPVPSPVTGEVEARLIEGPRVFRTGSGRSIHAVSRNSWNSACTSPGGR
ncbi:COG3415 family protein [Actinacidiphila soli]|uniref:hypothetical protein n=1 Tax=Actinacidiphila soli TaxID=2487275 RepID=UPI001F0CB9FA|nr:hypothetical protein [Actinacidiphila soli]